MEHKDYIKHYAGSVEDLTEELGNLRYDTLANFLEMLAAKLERDSAKNIAKDRLKLAEHLKDAHQCIKEASWNIAKAWVVAEPYEV